MLSSLKKQSLFDGQTSTKATPESHCGDAVFDRPVFHALCFPLVGVVSVSTGVSTLFLWGCPAAILRRVVAIIIDTVNGLSFRGVPHIFKEHQNAAFPSFADLDAFAAVACVVMPTRKVASIVHAFPTNQYPGARKAMGFISFVYALSAFSRFSASKGYAVSGFCCPTVTLTDPNSSIALASFCSFTENREITKAFSSQVDHSCHLKSPVCIVDMMISIATVYLKRNR